MAVKPMRWLNHTPGRPMLNPAYADWRVRRIRDLDSQLRFNGVAVTEDELHARSIITEEIAALYAERETD